jgi:hypothetical protein
MKYLIVTFLSLAIWCFLPQPLFSAEPDWGKTVKTFIKSVESRDRAAIAALVAYPLHRKVPLPRIDTRLGQSKKPQVKNLI